MKLFVYTAVLVWQCDIFSRVILFYHSSFMYTIFRTNGSNSSCDWMILYVVKKVYSVFRHVHMQFSKLSEMCAGVTSACTTHHHVSFDWHKSDWHKNISYTDGTDEVLL